MRINYLHSGGHDQYVLNRFTEMEYNARFRNLNFVNAPSNNSISGINPSNNNLLSMNDINAMNGSSGNKPYNKHYFKNLICVFFCF